MSTHTHRTHERKRLQLNRKIVEILRTVPHENGFHFYTDLGYFTGKTATNLDAFQKILQVVAADSVNFHFQRSDFQKWIEDTLGDKELARRIGSIKPPFSAEELRKELLTIVQTRIIELKRELPHHLRHDHS
jgi:hypothetical protein